MAVPHFKKYQEFEPRRWLLVSLLRTFLVDEQVGPENEQGVLEPRFREFPPLLGLDQGSAFYEESYRRCRWLGQLHFPEDPVRPSHDGELLAVGVLRLLLTWQASLLLLALALPQVLESRRFGL